MSSFSDEETEAQRIRWFVLGYTACVVIEPGSQCASEPESIPILGLVPLMFRQQQGPLTWLLCSGRYPGMHGRSSTVDGLRDVTAFVSDVAREQMMLAFCSGDPGWLCAFHFHSKEVVKSPGSLASPGEMN